MLFSRSDINAVRCVGTKSPSTGAPSGISFVGFGTMKKISPLLPAIMTLLAFLMSAAEANNQVPPNRIETLRRGININRWFSDQIARPADFYKAYVSPDVFRQIKSAGFTYVRVPLSPFALQQPNGGLNINVAKALIERMAIIESTGLGVSISPERQKWDLPNNPHDRELLAQFWDQLAPLLAPLDQNLTFVETLNEPNFPNGNDWDALQLRLLQIIRSHLPNLTILASGQPLGRRHEPA